MTNTPRNLTEESVRDFYNQKGWKQNKAGHHFDASLWEDLRPSAQKYVSECRLRLLKHLPDAGDKILDAASGPIQYPEYLELSKNFKKRVCVDISQKALDQAKQKLGDKGEYYCASLLNLPFEENTFDATISLHTLYHIQAEEQDKAVRELLRVTKKDAPILIVYSNPHRLFSVIKKNLLGKGRQMSYTPQNDLIYFHAHPLRWFYRFQAQANISFFPWRSMTAKDSKTLIPEKLLGPTLAKKIFNQVLRFEDKKPDLALKWGAYPLIVLRKK